MATQPLDSTSAEQKSRKKRVLPVSIYLGIYVALVVLTLLAIQIPKLQLGSFALPIAMFFAVIQAALVLGFFMNLHNDSRFYSIVFVGAAFLSFIFFSFSMIDFTGRGSLVKDEQLFGTTSPKQNITSIQKLSLTAHTAIVALKKASAAAGKKGSMPILPIGPPPEMLARGKRKYKETCALCHGPKGYGDGPGAAGLKIKPTAYGKGEFRYGGTFKDIMRIIKKGKQKNGMASYSWMSRKDRKSLAYYILSLAPKKKKALIK